ncbi:MAG: hypothetical protein HYV97_06055 [Bdellovibrio sp.]|nr:hypothetical protein [Bdellovibrio sp.]
MSINSTESRRHMTPKTFPLSANRGLHPVIAPLEKNGTLKTVASVAFACVDVARALGGIYLFALYRQTVGRITDKKE